MAYESSESGSPEIYVRTYPDVNGGGKWQVSRGGGTEPVWSRAGDRLFYAGPKQMMAVTVLTSEPFAFSAPAALFALEPYAMPIAAKRYDVAVDGRFLLMKTAPTAPSGGATPPHMVVVENWFEELKQRVPAP
jgi:serine/threonine-protein kinase